MTNFLGFLVDRTKTKKYVAKGKENPTVATMALILDDTDVVPIFTT
jgi:hypothetical protein